MCARAPVRAYSNKERQTGPHFFIIIFLAANLPAILQLQKREAESVTESCCCKVYICSSLDEATNEHFGHHFWRSNLLAVASNFILEISDEL